MKEIIGLNARVLLTALCMSVGAVGAQTPQPARAPEDPELQLQAIRQAIVGSMGQAPTRVLSTAWVDEKGALHETTVYNTDAKLKGVRVLGYLNDGRETRDQQAARLAADVTLPHSLKKVAHDKACRTNGTIYRMPLSMETIVQVGSGELDTAVGEWMQMQTGQLMSDLTAQSARWYATAEMATQQQGLNNYLTALLGTARESSDWHLKVRLQRVQSSVSADGSASPRPPQFLRSWLGQPSPEIWQLHLSLTESGQEPVWRWQSTLENVAAESSHAAAGMLKSLHEKFSEAVRDLDRSTECTPIKFSMKPLHASGAGHDGLMAVGEKSRLKQGDRLLVLDRQSIPSRLLEPGALDRVALAEVLRVDAKQTQVRQLAGPPLPLTGDWVAVPL